MTQPRDGNRHPSTDLFHSCFSPLPKRYNRDCLVEPSLSALRFILRAPCQPTLGNGAQSLPTLSFLCPQGVHTVPLLPLALTRPSSPSPPLSSLPKRDISLLNQRPHSFYLFWDRRSGTYLIHPSCFEGLCFVVLSTQAYVLLGCPRQTLPPSIYSLIADLDTSNPPTQSSTIPNTLFVIFKTPYHLIASPHHYLPTIHVVAQSTSTIAALADYRRPGQTNTSLTSSNPKAPPTCFLKDARID
jgi:hypothetical protein